MIRYVPQSSGESPGGLYDGFEAFRTPSLADYVTLLTEGMIVLDANVLIDLYRYHNTTRDEFIRVLENLKDRLWIPNQVLREFWSNRDNIIKDPREVDKTARELQKHLAGADRDLRHWAKRVRLPDRYVAEVAAMLSDAFNKVVQQVRQVGVNDWREFASDTNGDPLLAALEPILKSRVGPPFAHEEYEHALTEARLRGKNRIPPGYMDMGKEGVGPAGDYLLWSQLIKEVKASRRDVLFVTSDNKEDWWRKDKDGESIGPRQELAEELRDATGCRLYMLPPDGLLDRARQALRVPVSEESVEDVKQTSRTVSESTEIGAPRDRVRRALLYEEEVRLAILKLGYDVASTGDRGFFDFFVKDYSADRTISVRVQHFSHPDRRIPFRVLEEVSDQAARATLPLLFVTNVSLEHLSEEVFNTLAPLSFVSWREGSDDDALADKLTDMFTQLS